MFGKVKYAKTYLFIGVQCHGTCRNSYTPPPLVCFDLEQLQSVAQKAHEAGGLICGDPRFIINYHEQLTDVRIIETVKAASSGPANGGG